ncbi:MAG: 5'-nucleotidase [Firmicutes bacterium]|nr:5'-nucleotidase [Bacillota bacterium]MDI6704826.1 5'-nucleotidase C-terminal domain-containing protein [Bacillota bacterium]
MKGLKRFGSVLVLVLVLAMVFSNIAVAESVYKVQQGDVLWKIAEKYGLDWKQLSEYNNLSNPNLIYPGQEIRIPGTEEEQAAESEEAVEEAAEEVYETLTILHTNDMHGFFVEGASDGMGAAKLAAKVNEIRANEKNVLFLDAGDAVQGNNLVTLSKGENAIRVMNSMKYDAMTAGNHEFDYGKDRLAELAGMAEFPVLAANIKKQDGSNFLTPYIIKEMDGLRVGIFGIATPETTYKSHPKNSEGLIFESPVETAKAMVEELKGKVDVIIALCHLGLEGEDTSDRVAENVTGIDVLIDGHSHTELAQGKVVNGTLIVQAGEKTKNLGIVKLAVKDGVVVGKTASLFTKQQAESLEEDDAVKAVISEARAANEIIEAEVVAISPFVLDGERANVRTGETNLGNLITASMLDISGADVALMNGGGIRASIDAGDVTKGEILTVLPFGNTLTVIKVTGADIKAAIENGIDSYPEAKGAFPHIAGMTVTFDATKEAGNRVVEITVGGEPLDESKTYTLVTNDFLAAGGDGYSMFAGKEIIAEYNALDEVLIQYIQEKGFDEAKTDGRIKDISMETGVLELLNAA